MAIVSPLRRHSIGTRIFIAFIAMFIATGALGAYGLYVLDAAGKIVTQTYDGPLMAINFARSASLLFSQMHKEKLRTGLVPPAKRAEVEQNIDKLTTSFFEDLDVAQSRSLGTEERKVIGEIRRLVDEWTAARKAGVPGAIDDDRSEEIAEKIIDRFDVLIELTAGHSFVERRKAVSSIADFADRSLLSIMTALLFSAVTTLLLARRIVRPLTAAANVADRIATGELQAPIPEGGKDETGALLRSLRVMQQSIVVMMEGEMTQRQRAEREKQRAETASKAKSDFLSNMSHELRTPLNSIIGFAQLLEVNVKDPLTAKQTRQVVQIRKSGDHLLSLIDEVLDLSQIEAGKMKLSIEAVPLVPMLERVYATLAPLADKAGVTLKMDVADDILIASADPTRVLQVLMNLGSNALKYNRAGGHLTMAASLAADNFVRLMVIDTGQGIPLDRQKDVFQAFDRLGAEQSAVEGTGIGLNITRRLVTLMGGRISFSSEPNVGTTFTVDLPAWAGETAADREARPSNIVDLSQHRRTYTMLYVDDNQISIDLMQGLIDALDGIRLLTATHPTAGLELAAAHKPDVIVLDIDLPDMTGYEMFARLRAAPGTAKIPVMALSAAAMPGDIERGLKAGFTHYLTKPINVRAFFKAVEGVLAEPSKDRRLT